MKKHHDRKSKKDRDIYANIMSEIKRRNTAIYDALNGLHPPQPRIILSEYCYLQLRFMCELIALGCIVAHGELRDQAKRLQKKWHAGAIIKDLERLHPEFYPRPTRQILDKNGKVDSLEEISGEYLSKEKLVNIYGKIGERLHKGNLRSLLSKSEGVVDFENIHEIATSMRTLLNHHCITMIDPKFEIWTIMNAKEDDKVHVYLFEKI